VRQAQRSFRAELASPPANQPMRHVSLRPATRTNEFCVARKSDGEKQIGPFALPLGLTITHGFSLVLG